MECNPIFCSRQEFAFSDLPVFNRGLGSEPRSTQPLNNRNLVQGSLFLWM